MGDFVVGVRYFGQGFGMLTRRPKLLFIGMLPAVLTAAILLGGMIALVANIDHLAALVTPFAEDWSGGERLVARLAAGFALVGAAVLLGLVGFTAVTLVVGGPFYESIAEKIEDDLSITVGLGAASAFATGPRCFDAAGRSPSALASRPSCCA